MSTDDTPLHSGWDEQALREIAATRQIEAVVLTDRRGRVLHSELRREVPEPIGALLELGLESTATMGRQLGLGEMAIVASVHDNGALVCGRTDAHNVVIITSHKGNLGQLLSQVRRVFPGRTLA
ncbi:MAG TPA: hypothetical protein VMG12_14575 [Polyangiaceae bacterium]|nr:hypothetical protein [Polyangiaceae bacterium]